jgi:hypothetical protein
MVETILTYGFWTPILVVFGTLVVIGTGFVLIKLLIKAMFQIAVFVGIYVGLWWAYKLGVLEYLCNQENWWPDVGRILSPLIKLM